MSQPSAEPTATSVPLELAWRGKVREVYTVDADRLLLVASDRISAFDVVLDDPIPGKGVVLTQLTAWWLTLLESEVPHHMITADINEIVSEVPRLRGMEQRLAGRSMLCRRASVFQVECVIRGYLAGSAWKEYRTSGTLAGEPLPARLRESDRLEPAIFSPATKAAHGHDENITVSQMRDIVGADIATDLERLTRQVYERGRDIAGRRGIIVADTKFEFGLIGDRLSLVDEVLTPDSSRFWPAASYQPGRSQESFDKQPLRDFLDSLRLAGKWNGEFPAPRLSPQVVDITSKRYLKAYELVTGVPLTLPHP